MDKRLRGLLTTIIRQAVAAVDPARLVRDHLWKLTIDSRPVHILALGKAANGMATGALDALRRIGREPRSAAVVSSEPWPGSLPPRFQHQVGDHPIPGAASSRAADLLAEWTNLIAPNDQVIALLSGGTSSLIGAPREGASPREYQGAMTMLLHAGLPIGELNKLRRRISRWGDGRLAQALPCSEITLLAISDVPGDRLDDIGSAPFSRSLDSDITKVRDTIEARSISKLPDCLLRMLAHPAKAEKCLRPTEWPTVTAAVIGSNAIAARSAIDSARRLGLSPDPVVGELAGPADIAGSNIADWILGHPTHDGYDCKVYGGETVVAVGNSSGRLGGRCQELALAAGGKLAGSSASGGLLAAGTDGRDGATPAAGGFADPGLWRRISAAGRDPRTDLVSHDSFNALNASGDLYISGPTGTNVMDLVIAIAPMETTPWVASNQVR